MRLMIVVCHLRALMDGTHPDPQWQMEEDTLDACVPLANYMLILY